VIIITFPPLVAIPVIATTPLLVIVPVVFRWLRHCACACAW
jgi:hypothetical protein